MVKLKVNLLGENTILSNPEYPNIIVAHFRSDIHLVSHIKEWLENHPQFEIPQLVGNKIIL